MNNSYHFVTDWLVPGDVVEVTDIIADIEALADWWPAVYLDVRELEPGEESGVGKVIALYTKGWLPYTLRWQFTVSEVVPRQRFVLQAEGDFVGRGIWTFRQVGKGVHVRYDWQLTAEKPLLRWLSFALRPLFAANHQWAMRKGEESLRLELVRRRAASAGEQWQVPPPPGPTTAASFLLPLVALAVGASVLWWLRRVKRSLHATQSGERQPSRTGRNTLKGVHAQTNNSGSTGAAG